MEGSISGRQAGAWGFCAASVPAVLTCAGLGWGWVLLGCAIAAGYYVLTQELANGAVYLPELTVCAFGNAAGRVVLAIGGVFTLLAAAQTARRAGIAFPDGTAELAGGVIVLLGTLAGEKDVLDAIQSIALDTVYLQDISESQTMYYEIIAPENTEIVSDIKNATVTFTVTGVTEKTVTVNQFIVERVREGFRGQCTTESIQVTIRGLTDEIAAITDGQVVAVVDFSKLSTAGEYTLPVNIVVNGYDHISAKGNYQVNVRLDPDGAGESEGDNT